MNQADRAEELFRQGYNCAQAVFGAFSQDLGLDSQEAMRLASAFGAGLGKLREVCGAVSGMLMVAGLLYGYSDPGPGDVNKKAHYRLVQDLAARFRERAGSIVCREILKDPPSDPAPTPRTAEFYKVRPCTRMVMTAAEILDAYIREHPPERAHG